MPVNSLSDAISNVPEFPSYTSLLLYDIDLNYNLAGIYLFKVNNGNIRSMYETCLRWHYT